MRRVKGHFARFAFGRRDAGSYLAFFQNAAAKIVALRRRVDPADAISGPATVQNGNEFVPAIHPAFGQDHHVALAGHHLNLGAGDDPGLTKTTDSGAKQVCRSGWRYGLLPVVLDQHHFDHMLAKRADHVVVLAVNVIGDAAADSGKPGARYHRRYPAARRKQARQIADLYPGFD